MGGYRLIAALLVAGALAASTSWGASIPVSRQSELTAAGRTSHDAFSLSDLFEEFGLYDQTIGQSLFPPNGGVTRSQATQQSNVVAALVAGQASGAASAQLAELDAISANATSSFLFVFDVIDQTETLDLQGSLSSTFDSTARILLSTQGGETLFQRVAQNEELELDFDEQVPVPPGRYLLRADATLSATPAPNRSAFDVTFAVSNPIPLSSPFWIGSAGLGMVFVYTFIKFGNHRRKHRDRDRNR